MGMGCCAARRCRPAPPCPAQLGAVCRLLSTAAAAVVATLEEQLERAPWIQLLPVSCHKLLREVSRCFDTAVGCARHRGSQSRLTSGTARLPHAQVPGAGRGLFAAADIEQGMVVHEEAPMLCAPSPHALHSTCHHCLRPLAPGAASHHGGSSSSSPSSSSPSRMPFCSPTCSAAAQGEWAAAAARCDFGPLQQACREAGEKFPLMLARLACIQVQQQQQQQQDDKGGASGRGGDGSSARGSSISSAEAGEAGEAADATGAEGPLARGDPLTQLRHLCFANLAEPPPPWADMHRLLLHALRPLLEPELRRQLSLAWFCDAMARLHLNSFRSGAPPRHERAAASPPTLCCRVRACCLLP